jgi:hypothetical protein
MFLKRRDVLSCLATLFLVPAAWALPASHHTVTSAAPSAQAAPQSQSVSGKIASVTTTSFTLTVGAGSTNRELGQQEAAPKNMNFQIDKNTTIEGKLRVGASADVTYREDNGQNVAISVHVTP